MQPVETDERGRVTADALESALRGGSGPTIVVLAAGDLNTGEFDRFHELIPIAKSAGAWVHVDGAFGLIARASATSGTWWTGVELADSWAADAHKWLNVPYDSGIAIVKDREAHYAAMTRARVVSRGVARGPRRDRLESGILTTRARLRAVRRAP